MALNFGRPRTYCSADCRREMDARRRELAGLEAQIAEARAELASDESGYWTRRLQELERAAADAQQRTIPALR